MTVELNEQRSKVFLDRYAKRNADNRVVESNVESMWHRVSADIATTNEERNAFYDILEDFRFVPGGRILSGAGTDSEKTYYNCYVIPVEPNAGTKHTKGEVGGDSREAIFDTIATMVDIMSRGGGVGINWSTLRPSGSHLRRVSGTSSGPVGWMDVASKAVGEVEQGGSRRGAAMFMLDDWHPDILKFIEAKLDYTKITNANVSVAISDRFMEAVRNDAGWQLEFPNPSDPHYNTEWDGDIEHWRSLGYGISIYRSLPARQVWNAIVESAHKSGEPGVVFLDRYNQQSTGRDVERIISVNPCGEQGLGAYSVCNLGSMNFAAYVVKDDAGQHYYFDHDRYRRDVRTAFRFLDNVIDKSFYWDDRSRQQQNKLRRVGLGGMGLADALILLGIRYGSPEAVAFTETLYREMKDASIEESMALAEEKGPAEAYDQKMWRQPYLREYLSRNQRYPGPIAAAPLRNLFFLTQAPTGTTSILAGVNSGIEPYFAFSYTRKDRTGEHKVVADIVNTVPEFEKVDYLVTANDVSVEEHIAMQAAVQKYVDSSVSKTINGPNSHTVEDVKKAYDLAYKSGLKGLAYFRDGSGRDQVLYTEEPKAERKTKVQAELEARIAQLEDELLVGPTAASEWKRPSTLTGETSRLNTSMGTMYLTVNRNPKTTEPVEVFVNVGKAGSDVMSLGEAIGRLVSLGLQSGIPVGTIASQLVGVGQTSALNPGLVHAIGKSLADEAEWGAPLTFEPDEDDEEEVAWVAPIPTQGFKLVPSSCPECGQLTLRREEGCEKCVNCGYSRC